MDLRCWDHLPRPNRTRDWSLRRNLRRSLPYSLGRDILCSSSFPRLFKGFHGIIGLGLLWKNKSKQVTKLEEKKKKQNIIKEVGLYPVRLGQEKGPAIISLCQDGEVPLKYPPTQLQRPARPHQASPMSIETLQHSSANTKGKQVHDSLLGKKVELPQQLEPWKSSS